MISDEPTRPRPQAHVNAPTRSIIRAAPDRSTRRIRHEQAQPVGGRPVQPATQHVDPGLRPVDLAAGGTEATEVNPPFRLVLSLEEHLPAADTRSRATGSPLPSVLLLTPSLPLSWHQPSIVGVYHHSKTTLAPRKRCGGRWTPTPSGPCSSARRSPAARRRTRSPSMEVRFGTARAGPPTSRSTGPPTSTRGPSPGPGPPESSRTRSGKAGAPRSRRRARNRRQHRRQHRREPPGARAVIRAHATGSGGAVTVIDHPQHT